MFKNSTFLVFSLAGNLKTAVFAAGLFLLEQMKCMKYCCKRFDFDFLPRLFGVPNFFEKAHSPSF